MFLCLPGLFVRPSASQRGIGKRAFLCYQACMHTEEYAVYGLLAALVAAGLVFGAMRGLIRMLIGAACLLVSMLIGYFLYRDGFTYLSFVTKNPAGWAVNTLAFLGFLASFVVLQHGCNWLGSFFAWNKDKSFPWFKGLSTTVLMSVVVCWFGLVVLRYMSNLQELQLVAQASHEARAVKQPTALMRFMRALNASPAGEWICKVDPLDDELRQRLARVVVWLAAQNAGEAAVMRVKFAVLFPHGDRLWKLGRDDGFVAMVAQGNMSGVVGDSKLTNYLSDVQRRESFVKCDSDKILGWKAW